MECKNHPTIAAASRCAGCAEAFCDNCLVELGGQKYCGSCKVMAIKGQPMLAEATEPCEEAKQALIYAIVGLVICGIILEPIALSKAFKAKQLMKDNPRLTGSGKATAAMVIAFIGLALWVLGMASKFANIH